MLLLVMSLLLVAAVAETHEGAGVAAGLQEPCVSANVPVINISALVRGRWDARAVSHELVEAARNGSAGFFLITGHGLERSVRDMRSIADNFFSLPLEEKMLLAPRQYNTDNAHRFRGYAPATVNGKEVCAAGTNPAANNLVASLLCV